jgi:hypothetical protein
MKKIYLFVFMLVASMSTAQNQYGAITYEAETAPMFETENEYYVLTSKTDFPNFVTPYDGSYQRMQPLHSDSTSRSIPSRHTSGDCFQSLVTTGTTAFGTC